MRNLTLIVQGLLILLLVNGCTGTIFKKFSIEDSPSPSVSVDARQRFLIVNEKGGPIDKPQHRVICAEPSPDAFMALAASGRAKLTSKSGQEGEAGAAMAETAAAIAPRTQTIQVLRDGLYRACEAYMNGVIDKGDYARLLAAYDEVLITLVALENLRQQPVILPKIGGQASVSADKTVTASPGEEGNATKTEAPIASVSDVAAQQIHDIVRDYYCFQLGLKQIFYGDKAKNVSDEVLQALCPADK